MPQSSRLVITGPTASGKGTLGMAAAEKIGAEIISMDSAKVYRAMNIGTAKPSEEKTKNVPFHMIDVVSPDVVFSVADYIEGAKQAEKKIRENGNIPLYAGGTALYYQALTRGLFKGPAQNPKIRENLKNRAANEGNEKLFSELDKVDPESAEKIHPNDTKRLIRALEVYLLTGKPISAFQTQWKDAPPPEYIITAGVRRDRDDLYQRINARVDKMIEAGLIDEVKSLLEKYPKLARSPTSAIGYRETIEWLRENKSDVTELAEEIKKNTRRFAKRQLTWFRHFPEIRWFDIGPGENVLNVLDDVFGFFQEKK